MFCTSLRKRKEWAAVPPALLAVQQPQWKEKSLDNHDMAIPVPRHKGDHQEFFRLLLLSSADVQSLQPTMARIERLYHQTGERQVGIVFLMREKSSSGNGTISYMNLQSSLISNWEMPIIPLFSLRTLQETLFKFQRQLLATRKETQIPRANPAITLLPYCSLNSPIPEHSKNLLSEACHSIGDLAQAATSREGQAYIKELLSEPNSAVAEDVVGFWEQEFMME